jgi:hypothetical protein
VASHALITAGGCEHRPKQTPVSGPENAFYSRLSNPYSPEGWPFNAQHSLDFPLLLRYRPAWDIVTVLLSLIGMIVSTSASVPHSLPWRARKRRRTCTLHGIAHPAAKLVELPHEPDCSPLWMAERCACQRYPQRFALAQW